MQRIDAPSGTLQRTLLRGRQFSRKRTADAPERGVFGGRGDECLRGGDAGETVRVKFHHSIHRSSCVVDLRRHSACNCSGRGRHKKALLKEERRVCPQKTSPKTHLNDYPRRGGGEDSSHNSLRIHWGQQQTARKSLRPRERCPTCGLGRFGREEGEAAFFPLPSAMLPRRSSKARLVKTFPRAAVSRVTLQPGTWPFCTQIHHRDRALLLAFD